MATVVEFPTVDENQVKIVQEEAERRKTVALEHFNAIKGASKLASVSGLKIGYHAMVMRDENLWGILGFANQNEARVAADVSESGWFENIRIAEHFKGLPEELFCGMKAQSAKAMCDLPEKTRMDREWIAKASELSVRDFLKLVDEEMEGKARDSDSREATTTLKVPMPASRKKVIDKGVKDYAEKVGMDAEDTGSVIEAIVIEQSQSDSLIAVITKAVQRFRKVIELAESGLASDEIIGRVLEMNEMNLFDFQAVLNKVKAA